MNSHQKKNRVEDSSLHHQDDPSVLPQSAAPQKDKSKPFQPKKLRFITNQGAPQAKRRRVSTACLLCRKRKVACSGERPRCNTCMNNKLLCTGYAHENATPENNHANDSNETRVAPPTMSRPEAAKPVIAPPPLDSYPSYFHRPLPSLFSGSRNRMPYFRWLGPTAIMPGFKQMVVKINNSSSNPDAVTSPSVNAQPGASTSIHSATYDPDARTPQALPFYDNSSMPPSELITHLCHVFFVHLACNFPFLQRHRFLKDLEEKQVDTILVDAVCALAARFSTHHLLIQQGHDGHAVNHSEQGSAFAQRAKVALIDTYSTPSVAAVQAALLLAYNEFGESRDSGLWMYLGISIRLAQDLGLHKLDGLRYEGRDGSTPRCTAYDKIQEPSTGRVESDDQDDDVAEEQRAAERERVDTFWAVFFLDRVVSSGTGRRSTLQDDDIEISFPPLELLDAKTGWPSPFPALIRIVCLYGRVADLLNSIKEPSDITDETPQQLADMEARVTNFYQGLSPKLHFQAMNFHHYVKAGEGTNFVLLHFWFHTLIVLLHQPTLLKTFEGGMLQLFPNSQALSMSSAKTIADILSYSQLIDTKAGLGNPFTTQPIYIAACAFLKETAEQTATSQDQSRSQSATNSRAASPAGEHIESANVEKNPVTRSAGLLQTGNRQPMVERALARHTLLATAANQHYQLCYKALQSIETYWAGAKYIITVLDQKFKGVGDPLLYTAEEGENAFEQPEPKPSFTQPGWRRRQASNPWSPSALMQSSFLQAKSSNQETGSSKDDSNQPIGWTLTGTLNSPSTNVGWHFSGTNNIQESLPQQSLESLLDSSNPFNFSPNLQNDTISTAQTLPNQHLGTFYGSHLLNSSPRQQQQNQQRHHRPSLPASTFTQTSPAAFSANNQAHVNEQQSSLGVPTTSFMQHDLHDLNRGEGECGYGDFLIESQDVDMSLLGLDMLPWFDAPAGGNDFGASLGLGEKKE